MPVTLDPDFTGMTEAEARAAFAKWEDALLSATKSKEWNEDDHPRDEAGRFAYAGGDVARATGFNEEQKLDIADRKAENKTVSGYLKAATWEDGKAYEQALKLSNAVQSAANDAHDAQGSHYGILEREGALKESMEQRIAGQLMDRLSPEAMNSLIPDYVATASFQEALGTIVTEESGGTHYTESTLLPSELDEIRTKLLDALGTTPPEALVRSMSYVDEVNDIGRANAQIWWNNYRAGIEGVDVVNNPYPAEAILLAARSLGSEYSTVGDTVKDAMIAVAPPSDAMLKDAVYGQVRHSIDAWASSASDTNPRSMLLQDAAKEVLGASTNPTFEDLHRTLNPPTDAEREVARATVSVIYENTQKFLKDNGITEVSLHRGMNFASGFGESGKVAGELRRIAETNNMEQIGQTKESDARIFPQMTAYVGESVPIEANPLSSYATRTSSAFAFAGIGSNFDSGAMMLHTIVPAKDIFSTPATGPGCLNEDEIVVISRPNMTATVEMKINGPSQ